MMPLPMVEWKGTVIVKTPEMARSLTDVFEPVRWGILGTAGIARDAFLPALSESGGGTALMVGSRDGAHAAAWVVANGVAEGVEGYARVLEDPRIEAVYIPLPNGLHADWTIAALRAGKAVLCEKPLCGTPEETAAVLEAARTTDVLLVIEQELEAGPDLAELADRARRKELTHPLGLRVEREDERLPERAGRHAWPDRADEPACSRISPAARCTTSGAIRSGWRACSSTTSPTSSAWSPTPPGRPPAWTRSAGVRSRSPVAAGWCCRAGSAAPTTTRRRCSWTR